MMDQKELAKKLHTTQQQLSRYEVGENSPTIERFYNMCAMLDLEMIGSDYRNSPDQMEQLMPWHEFMQDLRAEKFQTKSVAVNTSIA